jgi:hypothetical protein
MGSRLWWTVPGDAYINPVARFTLRRAPRRIDTCRTGRLRDSDSRPFEDRRGSFRGPDALIACATNRFR